MHPGIPKPAEAHPPGEDPGPEGCQVQHVAASDTGRGSLSPVGSRVPAWHMPAICSPCHSILSRPASSLLVGQGAWERSTPRQLHQASCSELL